VQRKCSDEQHFSHRIAQQASAARSILCFPAHNESREVPLFKIAVDVAPATGTAFEAAALVHPAGLSA
jgi:hypothetical protein